MPVNQEAFTFFKPGQAYRPTHSFNRLGSTFSPEECLVFKRTSYSRYDDVYIYSFVPAEGGEEKIWFPIPGEGEEACAKYFVERTMKKKPGQPPEPICGCGIAHLRHSAKNKFMQHVLIIHEVTDYAACRKANSRPSQLP